MSNFDLKKYLVENKLTAGSRLNEGKDITFNSPKSTTKEEAMKELQDKIDDDKEDYEGTFRNFTGVKWVGEASENDVAQIAFQYSDSYIILAQGDKGLFYAYSKRS